VSIVLLCYVLALLPQAAEMADRAMQVTPYSGAAYGALVFVLGAACYLLYKELQDQQRRHEEHLKKTLGVLQMIESKLPVLGDMNQTIKDIERQVQSVQDDINQ